MSPIWSVAPRDLLDLDPRGAVAVSGGTIVRLSQSLDGVPVDRAELRVLVRADGSLVAAAGVPIARSTSRDAADFGSEARALDAARAVLQTTRFERVAARETWHQAASGSLVAAWAVEAIIDDSRAVRLVLAARDGRVLHEQSLIDDATFSYRVYAEPGGDKRPLDGPIGDATPHPTGIPDRSYPPFIAPSLVSVDGLNAFRDPWLPDGSTETVGNHADAYVDLHEPDGIDPAPLDFRAKVTAPGVFDHVFDPTRDATDHRQQQEAAITQLFYTANWLHDFWYDAGFTETAGNAQRLNYGRGGVENDAMRLEAQDRALDGVRNNANMMTPEDGVSPRMQMFVFSGNETRRLILSTGRQPRTGSAEFAAREHDVTAELVVAEPIDACSPITNDVAGKIAIASEGACSAELAAQTLQDAGAVGALVIHAGIAQVPPRLSDDPTIDTTITIPVYSLVRGEGQALRAELAAGAVTARMQRSFTTEPDSSMDTMIIAHEYGHYVHRRLTSCGTKLCNATSEGWGDFLALLFASRPGDNLDGAYPIGAYATQAFSDDPAYFGVRRFPYSADRSINALTFRHMADREPLPATPMEQTVAQNSEVHNAGEIWATVLWDAYVALQKAHPNDHDAIRKRMASYVVAGMLLMPPDATPTEARDAIAAAAAASSPADADTILAAFAGRGFGSCAISPPKDSGDFKGIVESIELRGAAATGTLVIDDSLESCDDDGLLDNGERGRFTAPITNYGHRPIENVTVALRTLDDAALDVIGDATTIERLEPGETRDVTFELALDPAEPTPIAANFVLDITAPGGCSESLTVEAAYRMNADDVAEASTIDKFDAPSIWTTSQDPEQPAWSQSRTLSDLGIYEGYWAGVDLGSLTDSSLVSPLLVAADSEPLAITFKHRYDFEFSDDVPWDGGVIELSTDSGATWRDITEYGVEPGYTHVLSDLAGNPLANRRAYAQQSSQYPIYESVTLDLGTQLAGQTFQLRFRLGTDEATGAHGWDIDNIEFAGIVGTPFPMQALDRTTCGDEATGCCDANTSSRSLLLALGVLALIVRRRRGPARNTG